MLPIFAIVALSFGLSSVEAQQWISPCPSIFNYDPSGVKGDTWFGDMTLRTSETLSGIWVRVVFDRAPLEVGSDFGEVVQRESQEYLVRKPNSKLAPGETRKIRISVKFNTLEPPPQIIGFRLNARVVCPENGVLDKNAPISPVGLTPPVSLISPCPSIFSYEPLNETDKWYGVVQLASDSILNGVWLRIKLDTVSVQLGVSDQNWFGEVTTGDNKEYLIKNSQFKVNPGTPTPLRFFIKFNPGGPIPKVEEIRLNSKTICPESTFVLPSGQNPTIQIGSGAIPPVVTSISNQNFPRPTQGFDDVDCGTIVAQPRPLITYGQTTEEGEWPWHAALYRSKGTETKYICGGSLISKNHVITVAHCVAKVNTNTPVDPNSLAVFLGKYFLVKYNIGIQYFQAEIIKIHKEYNHRTFRNDIAIIKLDHPADYTDRVRPICLWSEPDNDLNKIISKEGTVVGWGFDQTGIVTEQLFKTKMPVVTAQTCIYSYPEFFSRFTNEKTYCAGFRNSSSVCNGDSGGGMVFPKPGAPNRWQLRGLVSIGVALQSQAICDTKHYAVFTDVAKYTDWISQNMAN